MNYFVTGATGFIGRHLVEELLKREGTIYALVREGSKGKLDALAQRLDAGDRIVPVVGDLSKEGLGIEGFDQRIDHFFHLAAIYDMEADEEAMERANVEGTRHVVEFANSIEIGRFHHTSSIAVAGLYSGVFQEDMFDEGQPLPHAYHSTKYESEGLVRREIKAEKLLVFRPGIVVGHSETGVTDKIDGPYYFFKLLQRLRYALPQWFPLAGPEGGQTNIVPVDFVSQAMDHIAHLDDSELPGDTFHLVNPEAMTVGEAMIEFAKAAHAPQMAMRIDPKVPKAIPKTVRSGFKQIPIVKRVRAQVLRDIGVPPAVLETRDFRCTFDARDTQRALTGTGIACPPLSTYAPRLWDYWERNMDPDLFRDRSLSHAIEGKRILITGASSGIGRTTALKLGEAGGEVILVARTREKLEEVAEQINAAGGKGHVHPADLTDLDDLDRLTAEVIEQHGGVDILVNNAGRSIRRSVHYQYDRFHDFQRTMQLNYFASLKLILAFAPGMRQRKSGHVINISSYSVQMNTPRFGAYAASKAALDQFSRVLGAEAAHDGLHITTIYMSLVRTPMIAPTGIYQSFPALEPEEAAQKITDAIIDKPKRVATRLGTATQIFYSLWPKASDQIANSLYKLFPEKDPKKKELEKERGKELTSGDDGASSKEEELSNEAVGLAYLMRGVYF